MLAALKPVDPPELVEASRAVLVEPEIEIDNANEGLDEEDRVEMYQPTAITEDDEDVKSVAIPGPAVTAQMTPQLLKLWKEQQDLKLDKSGQED